MTNEKYNAVLINKLKTYSLSIFHAIEKKKKKTEHFKL